MKTEMWARFTGRKSIFRRNVTFPRLGHTRQNTKNNWNNSANVASGLFASRPSSPGYESAVCSCDFGKEQYLFAAAPCVWSGCPLKMPIGDRSSVFHHSYIRGVPGPTPLFPPIKRFRFVKSLDRSRHCILYLDAKMRMEKWMKRAKMCLKWFVSLNDETNFHLAFVRTEYWYLYLEDESERGWGITENYR